MTTFTEFVQSRRVTATPRGDFISDTKAAIKEGSFREPESLADLEHIMQSGRRSTWPICEEALFQARRVWREYVRQSRMTAAAAS